MDTVAVPTRALLQANWTLDDLVIEVRARVNRRTWSDKWCSENRNPACLHGHSCPVCVRPEPPNRGNSHSKRLCWSLGLAVPALCLVWTTQVHWNPPGPPLQNYFGYTPSTALAAIALSLYVLAAAIVAYQTFKSKWRFMHTVT